MSGSSLDSTAQTEVDPLVGIDAKTSWYPTARSWSRSRRRILGYKGLEANHYHVMSRTCGGEISSGNSLRNAICANSCSAPKRYASDRPIAGNVPSGEISRSWIAA